MGREGLEREIERMSRWRWSASSKVLWFIVSSLVMVFGLWSLLGNPWTSNRVIFTQIYLKPRVQTNGDQGNANHDHILLSPQNVSFSNSETPPQIQIPVLENEDRWQNTVSGQQNTFGINNTHQIRASKTYGHLERVEASLVQARSAIKTQTRIEDPDYVPEGPMYWNASSFHRSYVEMEKRLKVFIYEEGDPPVFHYGPCHHTYAIEGIFIQNMDVSSFRTRDPNEAHVFFLPMSVTMITQFIYAHDHKWNLMKDVAIDYVNVISQKYPYWNRTLGADHFMLACHDWGPEISYAVPNLYNNSIRALCNANTSEGFNPTRDVSIPEIHLPYGTTEGMIRGPSPSQRKILVFYAGGIHGPIRPILLEHWENKDEDVRIHQYLPKGVSYYGLMRNSRFCICPSGYEVASPRMVEALYMGCVPVLIKDNYVIPFSDVMNWKTFSVEIPVKDIPNLKKILMGISQSQYIRMQRRGIQMRRHFEVNTPPKRFDVFHMILHSIWLRRLNTRLYDVNDS